MKKGKYFLFSNKLSCMLLAISLIFLGCKDSPKEPLIAEVPQIITVASIKGQQLTGLTHSNSGRMFANFPRWRPGVEQSVSEVNQDGDFMAYPDEKWNSWEVGDSIQDNIFVAVQSVVASDDELFVIDTRNPLFRGVQGQPIIFVFDLESDQLKRAYPLTDGSFYPDSYINDVRIDRAKNRAYFTDSGHPGLVWLDLESGQSYRVLNEHPSTTSEFDQLTIEGRAWGNGVHSDGIALDTENEVLYYHALTGYWLYALPTEVLSQSEDAIASAVRKVGKTVAPDGMIIDDQANIYLADLEQNRIVRYKLDTMEEEVLASGAGIQWADTFSIFQGELYYTNSRIHEAGGDISQMEFTINKIKI